MMKRIICLLLCGFLVLIGNQSCAGSGVQHEDDLELALLGKTISEGSKNPDQSNDSKAVLFGYLEDAIYLCIDQAGDDGQEWLDELNYKFQVPGLPKSIREFTVSKNQYHQAYTHMGWDYKKYEDKANWEVRKNILLATVSKVFGFQVDETKSGNNKYNPQCVNMAKLIYYVHVLGDISRNDYATRTDKISLSNTKDNENQQVSGLIKELRDCISDLFKSKQTSNKYMMLRVKLNIIRFQNWRNGGDDSIEQYKNVQEYAKDILRYLNMYLPGLLKETDFFREVFY